MPKSPGHRKWPEHKVEESPLGQRMKVELDGELIKGTARYYSLVAGGRKFDDAVWTYEAPYEEHRGLKDRLAFYDDRVREIHIEPRA